MRIKLETFGGFAGLAGGSGPVEIDTAETNARVAAEIESLIERLQVFDLPANAGPPIPQAADFETYLITVEDGNRSHSVEFSEPIARNDLRLLKSAIQRSAHED